MKNILIMLLLFCSYSGISQQNYTEQLEIGDKQIKSKNYESALRNYNMGYELAFGNSDWDVAIKAYIKKLTALTQLYQFENIITSLNEQTTKQLFNKINYESASMQYVYMYEARALDRIGNFNKAAISYDKAISNFKKTGSIKASLAYCYKNAIYNSIRTLNYDKAEIYLDEFFKLDSSKSMHIYGYTSLSMIYNFKKEYSNSISAYLKGKKIESNASETAYLNNEGAIAYAKTGQFQKAHSIMKESEALLGAKDKVDYVNFFKTYGNVYIAQKEYTKAIDYFKKALNKRQEVHPGQKHRESAKYLAQIGDCYKALKKTDMALASYHQAMIEVFPGFESSNALVNPTTSEVYPESWIMTAAASKADMLMKKFNKTQDTKWLTAAAQAYELSLKAIQLLKKDYTFDNSKIYLSNEINATVASAIQCQYLLYQQEGKSKHIDQAFQIMEQNKANTIKDALLKNSALLLSSVPSQFIQKEEALKSDIAFLELKLKKLTLIGSDENSVEYSSTKTQLSTINNEYQQLINELQVDYPAFEKLSKTMEIAKVDTIQRQLKERQAGLLHFFVSGDKMYAIYFSGQEKNFVKIDYNSTTIQQIERLIQLISNPIQFEKAPDEFVNLSHQVYQKLFIESGLAQVTQQKGIIIIPDGILHYLPFEALVTSNNNNLFDIDYLIKKVDINYAFSVNLLLKESTDPGISKEAMLALAPGFENQQRNLAPLNLNMMELKNLSDFNIKTLSNSQATIGNFKQYASQYQFLHLSTHAFAGQSNLPPKLEFHDQSMFLQELYNLKLHAELVVLSACETGIGEYKLGEGVMSLARGFKYAGAKQLLSSLWVINERSSADLLTSFYNSYFNNQLTSSASLAQAKRNYLNDPSVSDLKKIPYYWAGLVLIE